MRTNNQLCRVYFTRRFVRGNLCGLTHQDSIGFFSEESAKDWIEGIQRNAAAGKLDYTLADYDIRQPEEELYEIRIPGERWGMKTNSDPNKAPTLTTQLECDAANASREYEAAHKRWMNESIFTEEGKRLKAELAIAREKHTQAVKALHPDWIVI